MRYAILFPGQGAQKVGMCADARSAYPDLCGSPADEVLGWALDALINDGPIERLTETQHAQPALYAVSFALWTEFSANVAVGPSAAAGHSLGEYTALAASGSLDYLDGLTLVSKRGKAMAAAAQIVDTGMAALLGADVEKAKEVVSARERDGGHLSVANINAPGQVVVAGDMDDLDWLEENARELGVRRAVRLNVQGAFHSPFMQPAAVAVEEAVADVFFSGPSFPVYANATAEPTSAPSATLVAQLTAPVRFAETLERMAVDGVDTFVHIGPGDVTAGLVKRTVKDVDVKVVSSLDEARTVARELSVQ
jgi:[acyl-carrier-protein] S-malonyltransferase